MTNPTQEMIQEALKLRRICREIVIVGNDWSTIYLSHIGKTFQEDRKATGDWRMDLITFTKDFKILKPIYKI